MRRSRDLRGLSPRYALQHQHSPDATPFTSHRVKQVGAEAFPPGRAFGHLTCHSRTRC